MVGLRALLLLRTMAPGKTFSEVDRVCYEVLTDYGYDKRYFRHGSGHSCGSWLSQSGRQPKGEVRSYNQNYIRPNMVLTVEPGLYIPGLGGFRHCDGLLVTESGVELLTDIPWDISNCLDHDFYTLEKYSYFNK